jgi:hypothetical protein
MICCVIMMGVVGWQGTTASAISFSDDFSSGVGQWTVNGSWEANTAYGSSEYTVDGCNGWQYMRHTFSESTAESWQLDFDYAWKWGSDDSTLQFAVDVINYNGYSWDNSTSNYTGYRLTVHQGGAKSFELGTTAGLAPTANVLASGDGYRISGYQNGTPTWYSVRLAWDADTHMLTVYKKVGGVYESVASVQDTTYSSFNTIRFMPVYVDSCGATRPMVDNVSFVIPPKTKSPVFTPASPTIDHPVQVTITCATAADIYYTTDGTTPAVGHNPYTGPVMVTNGTVLQAIAVGTEDTSWVTSRTYTFTLPYALSFSDDFSGGLEEWSVNGPWVANETYGGVEYTDEGTNGWQYIQHLFPNEITDSWELEFDYAWKWGSADSALQFAADVINYNVYGDNSTSNYTGYRLIVHQGGANSFELAKVAGMVPTSTTLVTGDGFNMVTYTNECPPLWYSAKLAWDAATNNLIVYKKSKVDDLYQEVARVTDADYNSFNMIRFMPLYVDSNGGTAPMVDNVVFTVSSKTQEPVFTPAGPYISGPTAVTLSCSGSAVYYSVDGLEPTTLYTGPVTVNNGTVLKAMAIGTQDVSRTVSRTYVYPSALAPVFSPDEMFISGSKAITISSSTPGAAIYYTTNGTTPSTGSQHYTGPVTVEAGTTLKAIAVGSGYNLSSVTSLKFVNRTIPIVGWRGVPTWESTLDRFQEMKNAGFTLNIPTRPKVGYSTFQDVQIALDLAAEAGMKMIVTPIEPIDEFVSRFKSHPALEAYFIYDEPNASQFALLTDKIQVIEAIDPDHWCYINLLPMTNNSNGWGTSTYEGYVSGFLNTVPVEILSYDLYPVVSETTFSPYLYQNLEIISQSAREKQIPFWAFALATPHFDGGTDYPVPTLVHLRFQVFSNLLYGAQGIQYYTYWTPVGGYHDGPIDADGNKTNTYNLVRQVNQEIQGLSSVFLGAKVVRIGHTGSEPLGTTQYTAVAPIQSLTTTGSNGAVVSQLANGDNNYLVVLNRDINNTMTLNISVDTTKNFSVVSKDGTKTALTSGTVSYSVAPADIVILNWGTPTLAISPASRSVTADAGTTTFAVSNNGGSTMNWSAQVISGSWASITSGSSGTNSGTISLNYAANTSTASRTATIRITATGAACSPTDVTIVQAAASTPGDFNGDGLVNATDIDLLSAAINSHSTSYATYDLTKDGKINSADMDYLITTILHTYYGDADLNHSVGVSDLSVLAAYYNTPSGASWANGDFDGNGAVGVSDLSILAANYNSGSASTVSWAEAYAQAFGTTSDAETSSDGATADEEDTGSTVCSSLGLSLIAGLALMGLMIVKLDE